MDRVERYHKIQEMHCIICNTLEVRSMMNGELDHVQAKNIDELNLVLQNAINNDSNHILDMMWLRLTGKFKDILSCYNEKLDLVYCKMVSLEGVDKAKALLIGMI
jgi:hypothetical protein